MTLRRAIVVQLCSINAILTIGGFAVIGSALYLRRLAETELPNILPKDGHAIGNGPAFDEDDVSTLVSSVLKLLVMCGAFIVLTSFIGCVGSATRSTCFMIVYIAVLSILDVIGIGAAIGIATEEKDAYIKRTIITKIKTQYKGIYSFDATSLVVNSFISKYHCCGMTDGSDFASAEEWDRTWAINGELRPMNVSVACCVTEGDFPTGKLIDEYCPVAPNSNNSYSNTGCSRALTQRIDDVRINIVLTWAGLTFHLTVCIVMTIYIVIASRSAEPTVIPEEDRPATDPDGEPWYRKLKTFISDFTSDIDLLMS